MIVGLEENRRMDLSIDGSWRGMWRLRGFFIRYKYSMFDFDENCVRGRKI